ncbi:Zinc finger MYM-type protein 1 [Dissostichus eleginoides]|uniref:Zinc finger MYM-type protein 1 n=1 Tax=Dissostichus eleginoides TaxID=100907 RepID=A0AAD9CJU0_DISEL|nr:Zinc finger MYM-type protein 1 [Dissostichus eleginoides]
MTDSMKEELRKASFVAVMLDETTDISNVAQMSYVLRYVTEDGIKERFFKYEDVFEHIVDHHTEFDDETVHCSDGYITLLTSFDFSFWLKTFHAIFSYSDVVFQILQNKGFDMQFCLARVDQLQREIEQEKGNFDSVYDETQALVGPLRGRGAQGDVRARYRELHCSIIGSLLTQIANRFSDHKKLELLALLDPQKFGHYCNYFPTAALNSLMESYGGYFDQPRLHTELAVM